MTSLNGSNETDTEKNGTPDYDVGSTVNVPFKKEFVSFLILLMLKGTRSADFQNGLVIFVISTKRNPSLSI